MTTRNSNVAIDIYEAARRSALVKRALNGPRADSAGVKPLQPPEPPVAPPVAAQSSAPPTTAPIASAPSATAAPPAAPLTPPAGQPVGSMPPAAPPATAASAKESDPRYQRDLRLFGRGHAEERYGRRQSQQKIVGQLPPGQSGAATFEQGQLVGGNTAQAQPAQPAVVSAPPPTPAPAAPSPPPKPAQPAAAQNQPQQPPAAAPEPAPKMPLMLPENTPPEHTAQIEGAYTQLAQLDKLNPNAWQLGREALQDPKSEAAQTVTANAQQVYTDPANHADKPPPDPQGWAGWLRQKQDEFQALPFPAQLAMGLGLGVGVVGLMSSLLGEGGMGSFLMSALGLGAAGAVGAGSGMFGQGAQNTMADVIGRVGQATGMVPKQLTPEQRAILTAKDPIAAVMSMTGGVVTPAAAAQKVQQAREAFKQLQMLQGFGGMGGRILQHTGLSPEEAAQAENNIPTLLRAYNDPNSALSKRLQLGEQYGALPERLNNAASTAWQAAADKIQDARNWFRRPTTDPREKGSSMNIAQQIWLQQQTIKAARCWAGYEPVPGKAPYSEDSCRPKGSKKTQKKTTEKKSGEAPVKPVSGPKMPQDWVDSFKRRVQTGNKAMGQLTGKKAAEECCATGTLPKHDAGEPTKQVSIKKVETDHDETVVTGSLGQDQKKST